MRWSFGGPLPAPAESPKSQGLLRALCRWLPRTSSSLPFPYGPFLHCSECSSFHPYLFNMHLHYTTLNVHRSSLLLRATSKSCTEIHQFIKDVSLHLADTAVSSSILGDNFCSHTSVTLQWYNSLQGQADTHSIHIIYKKVGKELQIFLFWDK